MSQLTFCACALNGCALQVSAIFPAFAGNGGDPAAGCGACAAGIDLVLDDGTRLSGTILADQYGFGAGARAQGEAKGPIPDQWNIQTIDIALAGPREENK